MTEDVNGTNGEKQTKGKKYGYKFAGKVIFI